MQKAWGFVNGWRSAQSKESRPEQGAIGTVQRWRRPQEGWLKANVDAAVGSQGRGLGWVLRDAAGSFVAAGVQSWNGDCSPLEAELLGIREVLSWLKEQAWDNVEIESDSSLAVSEIQGGTSWSSGGLLAEDIREISSGFNNLSFSFIRRSANRVAHMLAKAACSMSDSQFWVNSPPSCIMKALSFDLINDN
ncbi:unnamed protein product [Cuscuta epithymum]|uniref:RNase H type-1 domain-containing protein n=1 Tax=Cuscuta epithymum TaxID=186058 RepID=A0AAV0CH54_9ASTE|nr:unnamed protein product [Cuscuta epithymum]